MKIIFMKQLILKINILEINKKDYANEEENDSFDNFLKKIELRRKDDEKKKISNNQNKEDNSPKAEYLYPLMEMNSINEVQKDGIDLSNIRINNTNNFIFTNKKIGKLFFLLVYLLIFIFLISIIITIIIYSNSKEDSNLYSKQYSFELVYYSGKQIMKQLLHALNIILQKKEIIRYILILQIIKQFL